MSQSLIQVDRDAVGPEVAPHRALPRIRRGSLGALSAAGAIAMLGAVCLAADPSSSHAEERRTRALVEGSALAGAAALAVGGDAVDAATTALARSGVAGSTEHGRDSLVVVNRPPRSGAYAGHVDSVEVVLVRGQAVGMAHLALGGAMPMRVRAVATVVTVQDACPGAVDRTPCLANEAAAPLRAPLLVE